MIEQLTICYDSQWRAQELRSLIIKDKVQSRKLEVHRVASNKEIPKLGKNAALLILDWYHALQRVADAMQQIDKPVTLVLGGKNLRQARLASRDESRVQKYSQQIWASYQWALQIADYALYTQGDDKADPPRVNIYGDPIVDYLIENNALRTLPITKPAVAYRGARLLDLSPLDKQGLSCLPGPGLFVDAVREAREAPYVVTDSPDMADVCTAMGKPCVLQSKDDLVHDYPDYIVWTPTKPNDNDVQQAMSHAPTLADKNKIGDGRFCDRLQKLLEII